MLKCLGGNRLIDLKDKRKALKLSQLQIAKSCGITQVHYSRIERGTHKPSIKLAKKLADIFEVSWTDFFS